MENEQFMQTTRTRRAKNFTQLEVQILVAEVDQRREVLFGPLKGPSLTQYHRDKAWEEVQTAVNSVGYAVRRVADLKKKIKDLKNRVKTKAIKLKQEAEQTGGQSHLTMSFDPVEETMLSFIGKGIDIDEIAGGADTFRASRASQAKDTWVKLRNCYMNAVKKRRNKLCKGGKTTPSWKYEQEMSFLQPYLQDRDTSRTLNQTEESSQGSEGTTTKENASHDDEEEEEQEEESDKEERNTGNNQDVFMEVELSPAHYCTTSSETSNVPSHQAQGPPATKKLTPTQEILKIIKQTAEQRKIENQNKQLELQNQAKDFDESDLFYLSMSKTAKRLSALDQARIRMELCKMVSEAEIRQLETTPTSSSPSRPHSPLLTFIKSEV